MKTAESDDENEKEEWVDHIQAAIKFYQSKRFSDPLEAFFREHSDEFMNESEAKSNEHVEHRHEFATLHTEYLRLFEAEIAEFLREEGCSTREFFLQCRDAAEDRYTALFEEHQHHWFVDALMASISYEHFFNKMCAECRSRHK